MKIFTAAILLVFSALISSCNQNFHVTENSTASLESCPSNPPTLFSNRQVFTHTGGDQFFDISVLDDSICWIKVKAWGAGGGGTFGSGAGGAGGFAETFIERSNPNIDIILLIVVGSGGNQANIPAPFPIIYGGGGLGGLSAASQGGSGGGLSGVFESTSFATTVQGDSIIVAGAGAGIGRDDTHLGTSGVTDAPAGGGFIGRDGQDSTFDSGATTAGRGGTQTSGGVAGNVGGATPGIALSGGQGGVSGQGGGGGGSGYFGGGGGGAFGGNRETPGGGGSSFISSLDSGDGQTIAGNFRNPPNTSDPDYIAGVVVGGASSSPGGNGLVVIEWE